MSLNIKSVTALGETTLDCMNVPKHQIYSVISMLKVAMSPRVVYSMDTKVMADEADAIRDENLTMAIKELEELLCL